MITRHLQKSLLGARRPAIALAFAVTAATLPTVAAANTAPVAASGSYAAEPGEIITVTLSATDADSDAMTYIVSSLPTKGSLSVGGTTLVAGDLPYTIPAAGNSLAYTAASGGHGADAFQFKANDGTVDSAAATITVAVNREPTVGTTLLSTLPNKDLGITLPVSDADKDTLSFVVTALPGHGRLTSGSTLLSDNAIPYQTSTNTVTYAPDTDYHGDDTFVFTASDGFTTTSPIAVTVQINTAPVAENQSVTLLPDTSKSIELIATDADRDPMQYYIASLPGHGTLSIGDTVLVEDDLPRLMDEGVNTVLYTVTEGYRGTDSFHFRVEDGVAGSDRAVVTIAVNTPPVAPASSVSGFTGTTVTGALVPTDDDGDVLTIRLSALPETGTLKVNGLAANLSATYTASSTGTTPFTFSFTPETEWTGKEVFEWVANDGRDDSTPGEVTITIIGVPASGTGSGDSTEDGSSSVSGTSCGAFGSGGMIFLAIGLLLAPSRTFWLRFSRPLSDLYRTKQTLLL